jgi:AcrR family transcriptional regulator
VYQTVFTGLEARMTSREPRRGPILEAMIAVAGRKGYAAASVADVVAEAHASRATFYKYFDDKRDCFLAAYELAIERILAAAVDGCRQADRWPATAREGLAAIVDLFARDPALARVAVVEVAAAGDEARRRHWRAIDRLSRLLDRGRPARRRPPLPPNTASMAVGGVVALISEHLRGSRVDGLPRLLPELEFALLVPFVGPGAAACEARSAAAQPRSGASNL